MRNLKVLCLLLGFLCCSAIASPKDDAVQVVERWAKAFTAADVDTIVSLYASDAKNQELLRRASALDSLPESWREYFRKRLWRPDE